MKAFPLAVAEWTLESLTLADDDASAKYCSVAYVFHGGVSFGVASVPVSPCGYPTTLVFDYNVNNTINISFSFACLVLLARAHVMKGHKGPT